MKSEKLQKAEKAYVKALIDDWRDDPVCFDGREVYWIKERNYTFDDCRVQVKIGKHEDFESEGEEE